MKIVAASPAGILLAGLDMRILKANPAVCRMLGYDESALRELELPDILHPDSRARFASNFQNLVQHTLPSIQMEEQFLTRTGQPGWAVFQGWLEAVGLLAAGVAHDFNNLLAVMLGCSEQILALAGDDAQLHDDAGAINEAARRAAHLTRQLLEFSRRQPRNVESSTSIPSSGAWPACSTV
jgi:PAS domain S-box-containing protein